MPTLPSVTLAPGAFPFRLPWVTLSQAEVKLQLCCQAWAVRRDPLGEGTATGLSSASVRAGAAGAWEHRTRVEASAPGAALSPAKHPPGGRGIPGPCQGPPTPPLLALLWFFGRHGDKVFPFLPDASSCCSCLEVAPLAPKGSAGISPQQ